jgi:hypothetical protein
LISPLILVALVTNCFQSLKQNRASDQIDGECDVGHCDDKKVEPVPRVSQVGEGIEDEPPGKDLDAGLVGVDRREDDLGRRSVSGEFE